MKTIELTDEQIDIIEDILLWHLEDETNNDSLSRDEEYINDLKRIYNTIVADRFEVERMNMIKIKINEEDRETLASMLDYAVSLANEKLHQSYSCDADFFIKLEKKFKDLRQRIVFEEIKE